jgi:hypothetical protein
MVIGIDQSNTAVLKLTGEALTTLDFHCVSIFLPFQLWLCCRNADLI